MQRFKWVLCVTVPIWFGYGFARDPDNLEWVKRVVSGLRRATTKPKDVLSYIETIEAHAGGETPAIVCQQH